MDNRLNGLNALAYVGVAPVSVPQLIYKTIDPTPTDSRNFSIGCFWVNTASEDVWVLVSLAKGVATWIKFAASQGFAASFPTDSGTAFPTSAGALTIHGGSNINTSGSGSTVTVNLDNSISVSGTITAGGNIESTAGDIVAQNGSIDAINSSNTTAGALLQMIKNRSGGPVVSGDILGALAFLGFDGTLDVLGAEIISKTSGTITTNQMPSDLEFYTSNFTPFGLFQRMVINQTGNVTINTPDSGNGLTVASSILGQTLYATNDIGGIASNTAMTNVTNVAVNSSGTFTIASKSANNLTSTGFIKIYVGTTAYWVPIFSTPSP